MITKKFSLMSTLIAAALPLGSAVTAQESSRGVLEEIVVTAQKRSQSANDVPIAISAFSGDRLRELGVFTTSDLARYTPGMTFNPSTLSNSPIYSIRGVGFTDESPQASSTVGVYVDEVPFSYPVMTLGSHFDIARVEVLKGPQGTLYGLNTTGGAVNYFSNRPTEEFEAGITASYGRFDNYEAEAYISGPVGEGVRSRLAVKHTGAGEGWQQSVSRDENLGEPDQTSVRWLLDWDASEDLQINLGLNYWEDNSDMQAPLITEFILQNPNSPSVPIIVDNISIDENAIDDNRAADWVANGRWEPERDLDYQSISLKAVWQLNDNVSLTSVSNYAEFEDKGTYLPIDGTQGIPAELALLPSQGNFGQELTNGYSTSEIESFTQELRLTGTHGDLDWIAGVFYSNDEVEADNFSIGDMQTRGIIAPVFGLFLTRVHNTSFQDSELWAAFGQVDFKLSEKFRLSAGIRYTDSSREGGGCTFDNVEIAEDHPGQGAAFFNTVFYGGVEALSMGDCLTISGFDPATGFSSGPYEDELNEDAWSGRISLDYLPDDDTLIYASVSRGFKQGVFPLIAASTQTQLFPVEKETLNAIELGFKSTLGEGSTQLNGAAYYYDYEDKQLRGHVIDPVFNRLAALVNIPESTLWGAELDLRTLLTDKFSLSLALSYVDTEVDEYFGIDVDASPQNFEGSDFPLTPEWQASIGAQYSFSIGADLAATFGVDLVYSDETSTEYKPTDGELDPRATLDDYTVVDARLAIEKPDGSWRVSLWLRNLTDEDYRINSDSITDTYTRSMGMPRTYGITASYRWN